MAQQPVNGNMVYWSMEDFSHWVEEALDNLALETVMHRLFATGVLPTYSMEKELVENRWSEWQCTARDYFSALKDDTEEGSTLEYLTSPVRYQRTIALQTMEKQRRQPRHSFRRQSASIQRAKPRTESSGSSSNFPRLADD
jgi:hypothetical protein